MWPQRFVLLPCAELQTKKHGTSQNVMLCNLLATLQKNVFHPPYVWTLKMKAVCCSKILASVYQSAQCHVLEGSDFHNHHLENIRSCINNGLYRICSQLYDLCLSTSFPCSFIKWLWAVTISLKANFRLYKMYLAEVAYSLKMYYYTKL
jgi:hypothetical protein